MKFLRAFRIILVLSLFVLPFSFAQQTNVSLLYGWNGTVWTPQEEVSP